MCERSGAVDVHGEPCDELLRDTVSSALGKTVDAAWRTGLLADPLMDRLDRKRWFIGLPYPSEERAVSDSVYRVTEVIGVSSESWEAAAKTAVRTAGKSVRDLRVAELIRQDVTIENGEIVNYRVRLSISFKYDSND